MSCASDEPEEAAVQSYAVETDTPTAAEWYRPVLAGVVVKAGGATQEVARAIEPSATFAVCRAADSFHNTAQDQHTLPPEFDCHLVSSS